jgi:hypothetical protein
VGKKRSLRLRLENRRQQDETKNIYSSNLFLLIKTKCT